MTLDFEPLNVVQGGSSFDLSEMNGVSSTQTLNPKPKQNGYRRLEAPKSPQPPKNPRFDIYLFGFRGFRV